MRYNIINKLFFLVLVISVPIIVLFTSIEILAYDMNYYKNQYHKYNIYENIGIDESSLMESTEKLLDYIKGKKADLDFIVKINGEEVEFFSNRDKLHMIDVKNLFDRGHFIRNALFLILLFTLLFLKFHGNLKLNIGKCLLTISIFGNIPLVLLLGAIIFDFNKYFTIFHEIFFGNDLWLLDPNVDRLVNIFPESFFSDTVIKILLCYSIIQTVFLIIGIIRVRKDRAGY